MRSNSKYEISEATILTLFEKAGLRVPEVYYSDFSCKVINTAFFIMERLRGTQIDKAELTDKQKKEADRKLLKYIDLN